jgi:methionyl-tRNA formyltransferase
MRIVLPCATRRGYLFLEKLAELRPDIELVVFSFQEDPWEPPFRDGIRDLTLSHGGQFFETRRLDSPSLASFWETTPVDLMMVVSWRYLIPASIYRRPRLGTFVFHDSLLPAYRGFSPSLWAIINGEDHTGATLFEIADAVDSGDIVDQERVPIGSDDTISNVMERVTQAYLTLLERNLNGLLDGCAPRFPQDHSKATFTCKRLPEDNLIDWTQPSERIYNLIRAVTAPYPGAYTYLDGKKLIVWSAQRLPDYPLYIGRVPGRVVEIRPGVGTVVLTGDGALLLTNVQPEGQDAAGAADVLNRITHTLGRRS